MDFTLDQILIFVLLPSLDISGMQDFGRGYFSPFLNLKEVQVSEIIPISFVSVFISMEKIQTLYPYVNKTEMSIYRIE